MSGSTRGQVQALIGEGAEQLRVIEELYESSLRAESVPAALKIKIKNTLENQRSALEYVAHGIVAKHGDPTARIYFPIVRRPDEFSAVFRRKMKGVAESRPDIRDALEQAQPHHSGCEWLGHLATLTNENKHQRLTPQTRVQATELKAGPRGTGSFGLLGGPSITLGGGASITMSGGANISFSGPGQPFQQNVVTTVLVDWLFEEPHQSAIGILRQIQTGLPPLADSLLDMAGL